MTLICVVVHVRHAIACSREVLVRMGAKEGDLIVTKQQVWRSAGITICCYEVLQLLVFLV